MPRLKRDLAIIGGLAFTAIGLVGIGVGIVVDTLIHHLRDEGRSEHFKRP